MRQLSLTEDNRISLAGALPVIRAAMRRAAGDPEGEGRKLLVDKINAVARREEVRLTSGNQRTISKDTLDKWLSVSDSSHPPSIVALLAFYVATGDIGPIHAMLASVGLDVMTEEARRFYNIGRADVEIKAARKRKKLFEESL